jgi:predicted DNA-binding transcriptional regulator YafY
MDIKRGVVFKYTNYKGSVSIRHVIPIDIWYGSTEYHPEEQWLLKAYDIDKQDYRNFSIKEISEWRSLNNDKDYD